MLDYVLASGGYYYDDALMKEVANLVHVQQRLSGESMKSISQIAVFGGVSGAVVKSTALKAHGRMFESTTRRSVSVMLLYGRLIQ